MFFSCLLVVLPLLTRGVLSTSKLVISNSNFTGNYAHGVALGVYGVGEDIYGVSRLPSDYIHDLDNPSSRDCKVITIPDTDTSQVFYVQDAGVDESVKGDSGATFEALLEELMRTLKDKVSDSSNEYEYAITQQEFRLPMIGILHQTATSALITVPNELIPELDMLLPRFLVPVHVPLDSTLVPVPAESISRIRKWSDTLKFDADVADIVNSISEERSLNNVRGEDPNSGIISCHSFSPGARTASKWIKAQFEESGLRCELQSFLIGFSPNVICEYPSLSSISETIVLGAHYDSRGSFGSLRAPGADDDGSGTVALLEMARTIKNKGVTFNANVIFAAFAGEEQGLFGSRAYAQSLKENNVDVAMMIQADMLGYHSPEEPLQLGYTPAVGTIEVAYLIQNVSGLYSPELTVGPTLACCSDHQPFHQQGFAAMQIFERAGPIIDPMYHNSGDLSDREGYDINQIRSIAKVDLAVALHAAGFSIDRKLPSQV